MRRRRLIHDQLKSGMMAIIGDGSGLLRPHLFEPSELGVRAGCQRLELPAALLKLPVGIAERAASEEPFVELRRGELERRGGPRCGQDLSQTG
jgi:hypothetical protein